jgi:hypothetical protein
MAASAQGTWPFARRTLIDDQVERRIREVHLCAVHDQDCRQSLSSSARRAGGAAHGLLAHLSAEMPLYLSAIFSMTTLEKSTLVTLAQPASARSLLRPAAWHSARAAELVRAHALRHTATVCVRTRVSAACHQDGALRANEGCQDGPHAFEVLRARPRRGWRAASRLTPCTHVEPLKGRRLARVAFVPVVNTIVLRHDTWPRARQRVTRANGQRTERHCNGF